MRARELPSQAYLRQRFDYDPEEGVLRWREPCRRKAVGDVAGSFAEDYYTRVYLDGVHYMEHRLVWAWLYGDEPDFIDHINQNKADNRAANLRSVDQHTNCRNARRSRRNTSGVTGVWFDTAQELWFAMISLNGKRHFLGKFKLFDDAVAARKAAEIKFGFHKNHGRSKTHALIADLI